MTFLLSEENVNLVGDTWKEGKPPNYSRRSLQLPPHITQEWTQDTTILRVPKPDVQEIWWHFIGRSQLKGELDMLGLQEASKDDHCQAGKCANVGQRSRGRSCAACSAPSSSTVTTYCSLVTARTWPTARPSGMRLKPRDIQAPKIMVTVSLTRWRRSSRKTPDLWNFFEEPRSVLCTLLLYQILLEVMSLQCNPTIISWTQNYKSSRRTSSWRRRGGGW